MSFDCSFSHGFNQKAVYWSTPVVDGYGGRTFATGVEVSVRWEQRQELFIDATGQEARSNAIVFIAQDVDLAGYMYLGTLASLSTAEKADPLAVSSAYEIRMFNKNVNIAGDDFLGEVWL